MGLERTLKNATLLMPMNPIRKNMHSKTLNSNNLTWENFTTTLRKPMNKELNMKIQKKFIVKVLSALCAAGAILATTMQPIVSANPPKKLLGRKTKLQKENETPEKQQIKDLIGELKNTHKIKNITEKSQKIEQTLTTLYEMHEFYKMEPKIAKAVAWAIRKNCFNQLIDSDGYETDENIFKHFNPMSIKLKDILDRCVNNKKAQKFVAKAIKNWIRQIDINSKTYDEKVTDRLEFEIYKDSEKADFRFKNIPYMVDFESGKIMDDFLDLKIEELSCDLNLIYRKISDDLELELRKILTKCLKNHDAKKFVAQVAADLACVSLVGCTCSLSEQKSVLSDKSHQENKNSDMPILVLSIDQKKCDVDDKSEIELVNILTECLDNGEARKYIAQAIETLITLRYFDYANINPQTKLKTKQKIQNILKTCANSHDAKRVVASAIGKIADSNYIYDSTENDIDEMINLLSKCLNNNDALEKISICVYNLAFILTTIYASDIYDQNNDVCYENEDMYENNLLKIDDDDEIISEISYNYEDYQSKIDNMEMNNLVNNLNILSNTNVFNQPSNNISNPNENNQIRNSAVENIRYDLNKDVAANNISGLFNLLYTCINNSCHTGLLGAKSMQQLLHIKNFQDIVKNDGEIKEKVVKSLSRCWSLHTPEEPTQDTIQDIINQYSEKLFNEVDIKTIKTDKKIESKPKTKKQPLEGHTNSDNENNEKE